jgi:hypothetical protein
MWTFSRTDLPGGQGLHFELERAGAKASYTEVLHGLRASESFRAFFGAMLAKAPYGAFRWETPAVNSTTIGKPFECVLLDAPKLDRRADPQAFAEHFEDDGPSVVSFANLGRDAVMVVPRPLDNPHAYGHLAAFLRRGPEEQRDELWRCVGEAMLSRISAKPVWLSTAGAGVAWLHIRLDDRPKYYGHAPYRQGVGRVAEVVYRRKPARRSFGRDKPSRVPGRRPGDKKRR